MWPASIRAPDGRSGGSCQASFPRDLRTDDQRSSGWKCRRAGRLAVLTLTRLCPRSSVARFLATPRRSRVGRGGDLGSTLPGTPRPRNVHVRNRAGNESVTREPGAIAGGTADISTRPAAREKASCRDSDVTPVLPAEHDKPIVARRVQGTTACGTGDGQTRAGHRGCCARWRRAPRTMLQG